MTRVACYSCSIIGRSRSPRLRTSSWCPCSWPNPGQAGLGTHDRRCRGLTPGSCSARFFGTQSGRDLGGNPLSPSAGSCRWRTWSSASSGHRESRRIPYNGSNKRGMGSHEQAWLRPRYIYYRNRRNTTYMYMWPCFGKWFLYSLAGRSKLSPINLR